MFCVLHIQLHDRMSLLVGSPTVCLVPRANKSAAWCDSAVRDDHVVLPVLLAAAAAMRLWQEQMLKSRQLVLAQQAKSAVQQANKAQREVSQQRQRQQQRPSCI
jgi:hypothetical protein